MLPQFFYYLRSSVTEGWKDGMADKEGLKMTSKKVSIPLSPQELKLITFLREMQYGKAEVIVKNGLPIRAENIRESIIFDDEK